MEKKSRPESAPKESTKPKVRPPSAGPKLDSSKYVGSTPSTYHLSLISLTELTDFFEFIFSYKSMAGSSQYRFGVLAKIVKHMKTRHLDGDDHPLTIEDILDETNQLDIGSSVKNVRFLIFIVINDVPFNDLSNSFFSGYKRKRCKIIQKLMFRPMAHDLHSSQSSNWKMAKVCCVCWSNKI